MIIDVGNHQAFNVDRVQAIYVDPHMSDNDVWIHSLYVVTNHKSVVIDKFYEKKDAIKACEKLFDKFHLHKFQFLKVNESCYIKTKNIVCLYIKECNNKVYGLCFDLKNNISITANYDLHYEIIHIYRKVIENINSNKTSHTEEDKIFYRSR